MRKMLAALLIITLLSGCGVDGSDNPIVGAESSFAAANLSEGSESRSGNNAGPSDSFYPSDVTLASRLERFEQITGHPLREWTTEDFVELLSMSNRDLGVDLENHVGGRNFVFWIVGSNIRFPVDYEDHRDDFRPFPVYRGDDPDFPPIGYLKFTEYDSCEVAYPAIITIGYYPHGTLLGADLRSNLRGVMDVFGEAAIEYVVRVGGGEKFQVYFVRYSIDDLIFLFECDITGELTELPPHPPLPAIDDVLNSKIHNVHILKEDSHLLEQLNASILER